MRDISKQQQMDLIQLDMRAARVQIKVKGGEQPVVEAGSVCWVCGEVATVEVEICNPTIIPIKVRPNWRGLPCHLIVCECSPAEGDRQLASFVQLLTSTCPNHCCRVCTGGAHESRG